MSRVQREAVLKIQGMYGHSPYGKEAIEKIEGGASPAEILDNAQKDFWVQQNRQADRLLGCKLNASKA